MGRIATAAGISIGPEQLGHTLMHEHLFVVDEEIERNFPGRFHEQECIDEAVRRLEKAYDAGVHTLVDLTVLGMGRDVARVAQVAERTRVNIIVATGVYAFDEPPAFFRYRGPGRLIEGPEVLTEFFLRDLEEGVAGTGIRAGVIKCATDVQGLTPGVERILRAASAAHRETGAPIATHTHAPSRRGLDQVRLFREEGVDLERVVVGHCGDTTDLGYLEQLLDTGVTLGMDRFGLDTLLPFEERVRVVAELCSRGHSDRMVLSHDASTFTHSVDEVDKEVFLPSWHYGHVHQDVLPALRLQGIDEPMIEQMMVGTPQRILMWQ